MKLREDEAYVMTRRMHVSKVKNRIGLTPVRFELTPFRTGTLILRLRPLGHGVCFRISFGKGNVLMKVDEFLGTYTC